MLFLRQFNHLPLICSIAGAYILGPGHSAFAKEVSFNQDVFPILSDRCFVCHGPDAHDRKAKLRLDQADGVEGAYRTHDDVTAVKPGSLKDSELWYRITTDDDDDLMSRAAFQSPQHMQQQHTHPH